jgi:hypothetical protein
VVGVGDYIAVDGRSMVILADKEKKSIDASSIYSPLSRKLTGLWTIGSCPLTHVYRHAYIVAHLHLNFVDLLLEFDHKLQYSTIIINKSHLTRWTHLKRTTNQ